MSLRQSPRRRALGLALALAAAAVTLSACIEPPVTASGSGTVTISWAGSSDGFQEDGGYFYGDTLHVCSAVESDCGPANALFVFFPPNGTTSAVLFPGVEVTLPAGGTVGLPTGQYTLQAVSYQAPGFPSDPASSPVPVGDLLRITIGGERDLTLWHQSTARASADASCPSGWTPSWAQWPNDGAGGYTCDRAVYAYYPDEPYREPGWAPATEWLVAVARPSADAACPDGWSPSWAQWPNDGAGGWVCVSNRA